MAKAVKNLIEGDQAPAPAGGMPAPQSVGEVTRAVVDSASAVANLHKGAAEVALKQAEQAKAEAKEAKEEASGAYGAGLEEGRTQSNAVLAVVTEGFKNTLALTQEMAKMQIEHIKSSAEDAVKRLEAATGTALAAKDQQIAAKDQTISKLEEELRTAKTKRGTEEDVAVAILRGEHSPALQTYARIFQPAAADLNADFQRHLLPIAVQDYQEQRADERQARQEERERKNAITGAVVDAVGGIADLIKQPEKAAQLIRSALNGTPVVPSNPQPGGASVPSTFGGDVTAPAGSVG